MTFLARKYALRCIMSGRGIDFLENWIQQNVTEADKKDSRERAKELAVKCIGM